MRQLSRRATLVLGAGGAALTVLGWAGSAQAGAKEAAEHEVFSRYGGVGLELVHPETLDRVLDAKEIPHGLIYRAFDLRLGDPVAGPVQR